MKNNTILFIDDFNGISGDILLSAFLDAGFDINLLIENLAKIDLLNEFEIIPKKVTSFGLSGTIVRISQNPLKNRNFKKIVSTIQQSTLKENIKELSIKILYNLAKAEAKIHSVPIENVHFHEIGAIDTIIDAIGIATAIDFFKISKCFISTINVGKGEIITEHGIYPNPSPATIELLKGYKIKILDTEKEITTPTGAAIVNALECEQKFNIEIIAEKVGYGFGQYKFKDKPNFSRIIIGNMCEEIIYNSKIYEINFNVDDMTGEEIGYFIQKIMEKNILDISIISTITKKNRPGYLITILVNEITEDLLTFIFKSTTTSGIRYSEKKRYILDRYFNGNKKIFKSNKLKVEKWKVEFDKI